MLCFGYLQAEADGCSTTTPTDVVVLDTAVVVGWLVWHTKTAIRVNMDGLFRE